MTVTYGRVVYCGSGPHSMQDNQRAYDPEMSLADALTA
jgi:hypothetical protein